MLLEKQLHNLVLRGLASDSRFDQGAVGPRNGNRLSLYLQCNRTAGFGETVELRVVNLLYGGLMPLIGNDRRGNAQRKSDDCQDPERDSAGAKRYPWRGGGHKRTSNNLKRKESGLGVRRSDGTSKEGPAREMSRALKLRAFATLRTLVFTLPATNM